MKESNIGKNSIKCWYRKQYIIYILNAINNVYLLKINIYLLNANIEHI